MTENNTWSVSVGRWMGIPVRAHLFLLLSLVAIIGIELTLSGSTVQVGVGTGIVTVLILMFSILIHEMGHIFTVTNLGGHVNNVLLMPWGGNSKYTLPPTSQSRGAVFLAGPFVNGAIFAFGAAMLVQSQNAELTQLTNPFRPQEFEFSQSSGSPIHSSTEHALSSRTTP